MGQTPDEIHENIAAVRARMTETISAISFAREIRSRLQDRTRSDVRRNAISVDEALDRLPSHQPTGAINPPAIARWIRRSPPLEIRQTRRGRFRVAMQRAAAGHCSR